MSSAPFKLTEVKVKKANFNLHNVLSAEGGCVRYMLVDIMKESELETMSVRVGIIAHVELAWSSWLSDFGPSRSLRIGTITAVVRVHEADIAVEPQPYSKAVTFACDELNPMLDSFTTLFGIEHNIDITVERRLRPTAKLLYNLIAPPARRYKYDPKKGFWR